VAIPLAYNVRNLLVRRWTSAFSAGGIALVVAATVLLAALVGGLQRMLVATGEPDNLIVLRKGANSDGASQIPRDAARALRAMTGVARGPAGEILASPELVNQPFIVTRDGGRENVLVRGVEPVAFQVHRSVRLTSGRPFQPKLGEVVIGAGVAARYAGARLGSEIQFGRRRWRVVGIFDSGGTAFDSEIWADVTDVQDDTRRDGYSGVRLRVAPGSDVQALVRRIEADGRFTLEARPEVAYYREQAETAGALYVLVLTLSVIMATGAVFGALNTMYAAVASRTPEIGTLRALGFSRLAILTSFVIESVLIAVVAGVLGCVLALPANWLTASTGNVTFSEIAFAFRVTPMSLVAGVLFATVMGLFGGLLPALRAARMPLTSALREA
jgi:ABC-type lipoprotein release transport system permease subunit